MDAHSAARPLWGSVEVESNENRPLSFRPSGGETKKPFLYMTYFFKRFPEVSRGWRSGTGDNKDSGEGVSFASNPALLLASCVTLIKKLLHLWASVSSHVKEE